MAAERLNRQTSPVIAARKNSDINCSISNGLRYAQPLLLLSGSRNPSRMLSYKAEFAYIAFG
jgi:hypothetical protein